MVAISTGRALIDFAKAQRTSGSYTLNSTTVADLDTGIDLTLNGVMAGDELEVGMSGLWSSEGVTAQLDVATIVGGSPVNYVGGGLVASTTDGLNFTYTTGAAVRPFGGCEFYTLQSGDISSGSVLLRIRYKTGTAANKTLLGVTQNDFKWYARAWRGA